MGLAIATIMSRRSTTVKDVPADQFIKNCAEYLKRQPKFQVPKWADLVKTGHFKELAPYDEDWFYVRAASIARKIYLRPGCGIGALRHWYGGCHRRGTRTSKHATASGAVIRNALKLMEAVKLQARAVLNWTALQAQSRLLVLRVSAK